MFFFEDNCFTLMKGNPIGERLAAVAKQERDAADVLRSVLL